MNILVLDGHPGTGRLVSHLLDRYVAALPDGDSVTRVAVRDMAFDPVLTDGYLRRKEWEPDLVALAGTIVACDHLVVGFPMWWGAEPAPLNGLLSRLLLPRFAFSYRPDSLLWDKLLTGRSADLVITMDTPPVWLRFGYGNPVVRRWRKQILGFTGFDPVRVHCFGPVKGGRAERNLPAWEQRVAKAARSAVGLRRQPKSTPPLPSSRKAG